MLSRADVATYVCFCRCDDTFHFCLNNLNGIPYELTIKDKATIKILAKKKIEALKRYRCSFAKIHQMHANSGRTIQIEKLAHFSQDSRRYCQSQNTDGTNTKRLHTTP